MRIPGLGRVRLAVGKIRNKIRPGTVILLYHRVAQLPSDPQLLSVTPDHFEEHLQVLRKLAVPLGLRRLNDLVAERRVPPHGVVVTFDDGTVDNLYNAKPILARYDFPATVFIVTGNIGNGREFWWDELDRIFLQPGRLPDTLRVTIDGKIFERELGSAALYDENEFEHEKSWNVLTCEKPGIRQSIYTSLFVLLRPLTTDQRGRIIGELQEWSKTGISGRRTHEVLSRAEIRELDDGGLVEVGAHTVTHPVLSSISVDAQRDEIRNSKLELEAILEKPVTSFAYPYGQRGDYTATTVKLVREAGFACVCSNFTGVVQSGADRFQLPRFVVRDWDGDEFERRLKEWFSG
ncbi:MAG: hypothetical protein QOG23_4948 [Blastocatellia bacterium]|jgi:peptidoglycan/xylan/chitin deacetylase (PgdA/CDA1 family)|nr:hypothetical protein [Blastocatellia bacterium]